jgi:hypothetical protein
LQDKPTSKTKSSFYRRLYIAYLIDTGTNTVQDLLDATNMHRRTLQDTILALAEIDILCESAGGSKNKTYSIDDWGVVDKSSVKNNLKQIKGVLDLNKVK